MGWASDAQANLADDVCAVRRLPGLHQRSPARNLATGRIVTISLWDPKAHARFSCEHLGDVVTRLQGQSVRLEPPEFYEVVHAAR